MQSLGNMIKQIRQDKKLTQKELATLTGFKQNTISNHENGKRQLDESDILTYAEALRVSPQDLFAHPTTSSPTLTAIQGHTKQLNLDRQVNVLNYINEQLEEQESNSSDEIYQVAVTTKLAAGLGYAFNDYDIETVNVGHQPPRYDLASFISGDSMEPKYHDGDIVYLVDKGFSSYSGEICAIAVNDKTYLKKVYTEVGKLRLVSLNPKYEDIYIDFPPTDGHIRIYNVVGTDSIIA